MLYRIVAPHFVAGIVTRFHKVQRAAPIVAWTRGLHIDIVRKRIPRTWRITRI